MRRFLLRGLAIVGVLSVVAAAVSTSTATARETTIYRFKGPIDGFGPLGLVQDASGDLFGTTYYGGSSTNCWQGCGIVYELAPPAAPGGRWTKTTIHVFGSNGVDGYSPTPVLLVDAHGDLMGTTYFGGAGNAGCIYTLTRPADPGGAWTEAIVFSFTYQNQGAGGNVAGALLPIGDAIYGTTFGGGAFNGGTVYRLTPSGNSYSEAVIHSFEVTHSTRPPGLDLVTDRAGDLFGIRYGTQGVCTFDNAVECGVVYRLKRATSDPNPKYEVLHRFEGVADGMFPNDELAMDAAGDLFGTTSQGGSLGVGAFFELVPNHVGKPWAESLPISFGTGGDYNPLAGPTLGIDGRFYGDSSGGGARDGSVWVITPPKNGSTWTKKDIYEFTGSDGSMPNDRLIFGRDGALYGTTYAGGTGACTYYGPGCGVVYRITR